MADRRPLMNDDAADPHSGNGTSNTPALPSLGFDTGSSSLGFTPITVSPPLSPRRPGYTRLGSDATAIERSPPPTVVEEEEEDITDSFNQQSARGLGIANTSTKPSAPSRRISVQSIPRRPVGSTIRSASIKSPDISTPNTGDLLGGFPYRSAESTPDLRRERFSPKTDAGEYDAYRQGGLRDPGASNTSLNNDYQQFLRDASRSSAPSIKSAYHNNFQPLHECATEKPFLHLRYTWVAVSIVLLCLFSTIFSGIFLGLALRAPRYGRSVSSKGSFTPADAMLLTSVMAKAIELSFVTAFVAFLGQVLSRRAFMKDHGRGVTLSELSMWRWVVQPGTLITHWETAKYAGLSILGILSLLSAVLATLYSSAATALVQPMLKDGGKYTDLVVAARLKTGFANVNYVKSICSTPITDTMDADYAGSTCLQLEHAGKGFHNYQRYLSDWKQFKRYGNGTSDQHRRPPGYGLLHDNTTVTAQWIDIIDTVKESKKHGRAINRVSMAMPHAGVFSAARYGENDIMQPEELNSEGTYSLRASVPSPVMNVLCANLNETELAPIVYDAWPNNETVTGLNWDILRANATTTNKTVVDELFGWTKKDKKKMLDYPPVFPRFPAAFNTVMNHTSLAWGRDSIYLMGAGGNMGDGSALNGTYMVCKIHVTLTSKCATEYSATGSGGTMEALCEDNTPPHLAYKNSNASEPDSVSVKDWRDIGTEWSNAMSLNAGINDAASSNARLLTQLMLSQNDREEYDLNPSLPSPAEALAVMSGCTLLMSAIDSPYVMFWNYTTDVPLLQDYTHQYFNASLKAQQYASGGVDSASKVWMIILFLVFLMNILVLAYFAFHQGLVTDFSEPPNLFALAVNSPPSQLFAGSCGGGPGGKQYVVNWFVNTEGDHLFMEPGEKAEKGGHGHGNGHGHGHMEEMHGVPHVHQTPAAQPEPLDMKPKGGVFAAVAGLVGKVQKVRKRGGGRVGSGSGSEARHEPLRRESVGVRERELEDSTTRTQKDYFKLSKRTSIL